MDFQRISKHLQDQRNQAMDAHAVAAARADDLLAQLTSAQGLIQKLTKQVADLEARSDEREAIRVY